jgi:hypothetical protein
VGRYDGYLAGKAIMITLPWTDESQEYSPQQDHGGMFVSGMKLKLHQSTFLAFDSVAMWSLMIRISPSPLQNLPRLHYKIAQLSYVVFPDCFLV